MSPTSFVISCDGSCTAGCGVKQVERVRKRNIMWNMVTMLMMRRMLLFICTQPYICFMCIYRERESTHARKHRPNYVPADCMALAASHSTCSRDALSLSICRISRQPGGRLWSSTNLTFDEYMFEMNGKVYKP